MLGTVKMLETTHAGASYKNSALGTDWNSTQLFTAVGGSGADTGSPHSGRHWGRLGDTQHRTVCSVQGLCVGTGPGNKLPVCVCVWICVKKH